jgi:hypothetical protein
MEDHIRAVRNFRTMTAEEIADDRMRALWARAWRGMPTLEYWKRKA